MEAAEVLLQNTLKRKNILYDSLRFSLIVNFELNEKLSYNKFLKDMEMFHFRYYIHMTVARGPSRNLYFKDEDGNKIVLDNKEELPISRTKIEAVKQKHASYMRRFVRGMH